MLARTKIQCTFALAFERKGSHFERMKIEGLEKKVKKFFQIEKSDYLCAPNRKRGKQKRKTFFELLQQRIN